MNAQTNEERKAQILIKLRGYKLVNRKEQQDTINFVVKLPKGKRAIILCVLNRKVVGVAIVRKLGKRMETIGVEKGVIVANARYTWAAKREAKNYGIELIPRRFPSFNIFEHELMPKHEIFPAKKQKTF